jgi:hypothetical protein
MRAGQLPGINGFLAGRSNGEDDHFIVANGEKRSVPALAADPEKQVPDLLREVPSLVSESA